ncbi:unnamed protein product [Rotaria magnacalcarata]|uniref:EF-hand domain-containing protein n=2 Tax=Rotaria magnacalcarata TaxID=392030 RepID=A0A816M7N8_9BILA|nr:unnamed protein product [Rotaria magnacalcarata]CAF1563001.1 unnamed protein product [Rotaria magnacalcarata]CAF1981357.1 unnamed protein product [Rotaria magnacalcarata]CAF2114822.1 unnamed protein product [Rotaria magnacalcarata]CAF2218471.1 unnamed protein product [Rotaria magnacalcarata]
MPKKGRIHMDLTPKECDLLTANASFTEQEIQEWHADFLRQFPSGTLDKKTFSDYYQKLQPNDETDIEQIFDRVDINDDGTIDFNELLALIAVRKKFGNIEQRLDFVFDLWDDSDDGKIDRKELTNWISAMYYRAGVMDQKNEWDPKKRAKEIIAKLDISGDKKLSKQEFINGCKNDPVIYGLLVPHA